MGKFHTFMEQNTKTIAVIGLAHSGTTMVAGILAILGVPMVGDNPKEEKWEDQDILDNFYDKKGLGEIIEERNKEFPVWGFKQPGGWDILPFLQKSLRNPVFIVCMKNLITVSKRRFGNRPDRFPGQLLDSMDAYRQAIRKIRRFGVHIEYIVYEDALIDPEKFVRRVADLAGLHPPQELIDKAARYIQPSKDHTGPYPPIRPHL